VSECVGFNVAPNTIQVISGTAFPGKMRMHTHNNGTAHKFNFYSNGTENLTITENLNIKHKTQKLTNLEFGAPI